MCWFCPVLSWVVLLCHVVLSCLTLSCALLFCPVLFFVCCVGCVMLNRIVFSLLRCLAWSWALLSCCLELLFYVVLHFLILSYLVLRCFACFMLYSTVVSCRVVLSYLLVLSHAVQWWAVIDWLFDWLTDWWSLIQRYSPLSWADLLRSHVVLHEWLAFYSVFLFLFFLISTEVVYLQRWHGWCHMKLQPSRRKFCVHHTNMHHVTSCKATSCKATCLCYV